MSIQHLAATSLGRTVQATATITEIKKRSIQFTVTAKDSTGSVIGKGTHGRAVVGVEKFMKRAVEKPDVGNL